MQDKGQHQKREEKRLADELPAAVLADQAAHNSFASGYVGGVIDCLEGRYVPNLKAREYSDDQVRAKIDEIVRKAAEAGIVFTADQIDYFKNFATRKQDAWDSALIFKGGAEETIELPMNKVVTLLLSSFEDDQQFKYSKTFKQRVEKLQGWLANTMNRKQVCNVGRRNDFVAALLEGDYFLEILPERCVQVIYDQHLFLKHLLSQFFESHWHKVYEKSSERASKILLEWRTGIVLGYLDVFLERGAIAESVPIEQQKGQFEEELKSYLKTRVSHTFISPARWETPIMNMVVTRNLSDCPIIEEYRTQIQALDEVHQFLSQQTSDKEVQALFDGAKKQLITDLVDIGKFNTPTIKGLSVFVRLYQQAVPYRNIFAIGAQEQRFVAIARAVIALYEHPDLLRWLLGQEIPENSPFNTVDAEVLESQFSESKQAYRVGISAEIENSFAVLAECEGREKTERFNSYRRKILDAGFLVDERAFQSWYTQFLQVSEDQTSVAITLTPLAINKIIWQGLLSCPSQWTPTFTVAFGQVLALLKKLDEEGDEVQKLYRRSSFHTKFVVQLHWMLQIARDPHHDLQFDKVPEIYLPVTLVSCTADLKKIDHKGETALRVAVKCGSAEQVKAFLDDERLSAEVVCHADKDGDTALHRAADRGNTEIVKVLLASDKLPSEAVCHTDLYRRTALHIAVREGNTEIVKVLLASDKVTSEAVCHADINGKTALHRAALKGHTEIVRVLLESDKLPSEAVCHANEAGNTALHRAAARGHTELVKVLLASDKLPSKAVCHANEAGNTALHGAAVNGHTEIVKVLLATDKLPSEAVCHADKDGETALHRAVEKGNTEIVKALLASDKLPSKAVCHADRDGDTALGIAAATGETEIVKVLLASDKLTLVAVCYANKNGNTALHRAAVMGHTEIVKVLLASDKLPSEVVCHANEAGHTALHYAVPRGHTEIVKVLLASDKLTSVAVCHADKYGETVLHCAAARGHTEIVETLLASDKLPSEAVCHANRSGCTALHFAAAEGLTEIVKTLLATDKLPSEAVCRANEAGKTALHRAAARGHTEIVKVLLASDKVTSEAVCHADNEGKTALHRAVVRGKTEIVKVLLASDKVTSEAVCHADKDGEIALHRAAFMGHTEIVKVLLASDKLTSEMVCHANNEGKTALHSAVYQGSTEILKALLATDKLTLAVVCRVNKDGLTALILAEKSGQTEIVRELKNWLAAHDERPRLVSATQNQLFGGDSEGAPILKAPAKKAVLAGRVPTAVTGQPQFFGGNSTGAPVLKAPLKRAVLVARSSEDNGKINLSLTESNFELVCKRLSDSHKNMSEQMKVVEWLEKHSKTIKEQQLRPEFIVRALVRFIQAEGDRKTVEKLLISFGLERLFSLEPYSPTGPGFFSRLFSSVVYSSEAATAYCNLMSENTHFTEGERDEIRKLVEAEGDQSPLCDFLKTARYRQKVEVFRSAEHKITGTVRLT